MTREEAAKIIKECKEKGFKHTFYTLNDYHVALDMAIKALERERILDNIRAEIVNINLIRDEYSQRQNDYCDGVEFAKKYALHIIDKYKAESEENKNDFEN